MKVRGRLRWIIAPIVLLLVFSIVPALPSAAQSGEGTSQLFLPQVGSGIAVQAEEDVIVPDTVNSDMMG